MPKESSPSISSTSQRSQDNVFIYKFEGKCMVATRQTCYKNAEELCRKLFPAIATSSTIEFYTKDLDACEGELIQVSEVSWKDIAPLLKSATVVEVKTTSPVKGNTGILATGTGGTFVTRPTALHANSPVKITQTSNSSAPATSIKATTTTGDTGKIKRRTIYLSGAQQTWKVDVHDLSGMIHPFVIARTMELGRIIDSVCRSAKLAEKDIQFIYRPLVDNPKLDREIRRSDTPGSIGMEQDQGYSWINRVDIVRKDLEPASTSKETSSLSQAESGAGAGSSRVILAQSI